MKSCLTHPAWILLLVGCAILGSSTSSWADWIPSGKTEDAEIYYDNQDLKRSSSGIVTVWTKHVYTKKGVRDMVNVLGAPFENLDHSIQLFELDCVGKMILSLSTVYFSKNGGLLDIQEAKKEWEFISAGSIFDGLYGQLCPHHP